MAEGLTSVIKHPGLLLGQMPHFSEGFSHETPWVTGSIWGGGKLVGGGKTLWAPRGFVDSQVMIHDSFSVANLC